MKKDDIIQSVQIAIHGTKSGFATPFTPNFVEQLHTAIRYMSVHVLLVTPTQVTYVGNSFIARLLSDEFGGKLRHSVDRYWQGKAGISQILEFLNIHSSVQILRFSIQEKELPSAVSGIQRLFANHHYTFSDDCFCFAYFGKYSTARRLQKAIPECNPHLSKYAHYWLVYFDNGSTIREETKRKLIRIIENK